MHIDGVVWSEILAKLADRFQERQALDVANGATHLCDDHVDVVAIADSSDAGFDLVCDVRDDLHGAAEIVSTTFLLDDGQVHRTGRHVGIAPEILAGETFVVSEVEVGLAPIVGDEHLSVLEGVHRSRIDVDVRIQLLVDDAQTPCFEESSKGGCSDPLPKTGDHTTRYEHILRHGTSA
ncbi:hypothetical protein BMS3Bbin01_01331 [bacterium BMS3Bbin01]|nr:hypothetical protein BMS3Bbin01_01331 [bacterium BMS3Bbin01]